MIQPCGKPPMKADDMEDAVGGSRVWGLGVWVLKRGF